MSETSRAILAQLTLEEKCRLCAQDNGSYGRVERLGLPGSVPQDNPRGGADYFPSGAPKEGDGEYHPVAFPSDACLAMGWDEELAEETGKAFGLLCRANPAGPMNWLFRPGVNIKRSPLCGRNFEYFSEDPVLAGKLAGAYIRGLQSEGVAATLKHYICNNQEFERMTTDSVVSERALREVYLRAFQLAIEEGDPWSVMSSYNMVNGEWVNSNRHICDLLRKELGFEGVVVSDFAAVHHNKAEAHACGMMDAELAPYDIHSDELLQAVKEGRVSEETIDRGLERLFDLVERLYECRPAEVDQSAMHEKARLAAEQCTVLLKNDGILPLSGSGCKLLVVGALAETPSFMGGGSGHMNGWHVDSAVSAMRGFAPLLEVARGYPLNEGTPPVEKADEALIAEAVAKAKNADTVVVFAGLGFGYESEGYDRPDLQLPPAQQALLDALCKLGKPIVLVLSCGSVLDISRWESSVSAIVYNSLGGEAVGSATANVLFGAAEPGGRLAETWPVQEADTPAFLNFAGNLSDHPRVVYGEDIFVGYRWYEKRRITPLFPFGHGLSYTEFRIGEPALSASRFRKGETLTLQIPIQNTGSRPGSTVLQLYVSHPRSCTQERPEKELKAFRKVHLAAGENTVAELKLTDRAFESFAPAREQWIIEEGGYTLHVALSAENILCSLPVQVESDDLPFVCTEMTAISWLIDNPKFHRILAERFPQAEGAFQGMKASGIAPLIVALPFYKMAETFTGPAMFTTEEICSIVKAMNET